jgi:class 3 adenylate cyclase
MKLNDSASSALSTVLLNRTLIGSVLFVDIVGYSRRTVPDQVAMKDAFNRLLSDALGRVTHSDRIIVDTGDGAGVAFLGDPEDALFTALALWDAFEGGLGPAVIVGAMRMGINLGPLKIVRDINGHANIVGDGVNDAQRVMSFSEPGQVLVSRSYYDMVSRFSHDYSHLFVYEGMRHDKHVREHEVYRFGHADGAENLAKELIEKVRGRSHAREVDTLSIQRDSVSSSKTLHTPLKAKISKTSVFGSAIFAAAITGTVWSWTATPEQGRKNSIPVENGVTAAGGGPGASHTVPPSVPLNSTDAKPLAAISAETRTPPPLPKAIESPELKPVAKQGTVNFSVQPWGEIFVDGSKRGVSPPLKSLMLSPGKHRIMIRNGQFSPHQVVVDVKRDRATTVYYVF